MDNLLNNNKLLLLVFFIFQPFSRHTVCISFDRTRRLPVLHIFGKWPVNISSCLEKFKQLFPDPTVKVLVFSDVMYNHCMGKKQTGCSLDIGD